MKEDHLGWTHSAVVFKNFLKFPTVWQLRKGYKNPTMKIVITLRAPVCTAKETQRKIRQMGKAHKDKDA